MEFAHTRACAVGAMEPLCACGSKPHDTNYADFPADLRDCYKEVFLHTHLQTFLKNRVGGQSWVG